MGFDSFAPDFGTLIAKTRNADLPVPFMWVIDANPETLEMVDYHRPDGTPQMIVEGDYRQIANALFKVGTRVQSEHVDEHNGLRFYVLDTRRDDDGALSYRVAVRSLEAGGPFPRGVEVTGGEVTSVTPGRVAACTFEVENTGGGAPALPDPLAAPDQVAERRSPRACASRPPWTRAWPRRACSPRWPTTSRPCAPPPSPMSAVCSGGTSSASTSTRPTPHGTPRSPTT